MNKETIEKLKNSDLRVDNELALEYLFMDYVTNHMRATSNNAKRKGFLNFVKADPNDAPFLGKIHLGAWFWYRYKQYKSEI